MHTKGVTRHALSYFSSHIFHFGCEFWAHFDSDRISRFEFMFNPVHISNYRLQSEEDSAFKQERHL